MSSIRLVEWKIFDRT